MIAFALRAGIAPWPLTNRLIASLPLKRRDRFPLRAAGPDSHALWPSHIFEAGFNEGQLENMVGRN